MASALLATEASAQGSVIVTPTFGYQLGGELAVSAGRLELESSEVFGGQLDIEVRRDSYVTLLYTRQPTTLDIQRSLGDRENLFDIAVSQFQFGGMNMRDLGSPVKPFGLVTFGAVQFAPDDPDFGDEWKFSMMLGAGAQIELSEAVNLRAQARVPITVLWSSGSMFCGVGGCYAGLSTSGMAQIEFSGGLSFVIPRGSR